MFFKITKYILLTALTVFITTQLLKATDKRGLKYQLEDELVNAHASLLTDLHTFINDTPMCRMLMEQYISQSFSEIDSYVQEDIFQIVFDLNRFLRAREYYGGQMQNFGCKSGNVIWLSSQFRRLSRELTQTIGAERILLNSAQVKMIDDTII